MSTLDLRPLSIGELLDRTFSLYRRNFLLFVGISAIPQLLVLALQLVQVILMPSKVGVARPTAEEFQVASPVFTIVGVAGAIVLGLVGIIVYFIAYLFSQGGSVFAVSELYLGRATTIGQSLSRVTGELGLIFGVVFLHRFGSRSFFPLPIHPGIFNACRLCVCIP